MTGQVFGVSEAVYGRVDEGDAGGAEAESVFDGGVERGWVVGAGNEGVDGVGDDTLRMERAAGPRQLPCQCR